MCLGLLEIYGGACAAWYLQAVSLLTLPGVRGCGRECRDLHRLANVWWLRRDVCVCSGGGEWGYIKHTGSGVLEYLVDVVRRAGHSCEVLMSRKDAGGWGGESNL